MTKTKTIKIPTRWEDVTLGQFRQLHRAVQIEDEALRSARVLSAVTDLTAEEALYQVPYSQALPLANKVIGLYNHKVPGRLQELVELGGVEFGFHPSLMEMSGGEYADLSNLDSGFWASADQAMAILYRPVTDKVGDKYRIEDYRGAETLESAKLFRDLPMDVVFGAATFFLTLTEELETAILTFSERMSLTAMRETVQAALELLPGMVYSSNSPAGNSSKSMP